jgi:hypothetical protein
VPWPRGADGADKDGDSQLDFEEFNEMVDKRADAKEFPKNLRRQLFDELDKDKYEAELGSNHSEMGGSDEGG